MGKQESVKRVVEIGCMWKESRQRGKCVGLETVQAKQSVHKQMKQRRKMQRVRKEA